MKSLTFILGFALLSSSFALLQGYIPVTDQFVIAANEDVLTQGVKTALILARGDPKSPIIPSTYKIWTLHEFGYQEGELGTFYQMIVDVVHNDDTSKLIATVNCVIFQDGRDGSYVFLSYKVTPPNGESPSNGTPVDDNITIPTDDDLNILP